MALEKLSDTDKERWQSLASRWLIKKDNTTTHNAVGWLLRKWVISPPEILEARKIVPKRHWLVNSAGMTMLRMMLGSFHQLAESNKEQQARDVEFNEIFGSLIER
jgi:hypothetical protein